MLSVLVLAVQLAGGDPRPPSVELSWQAPAGCPGQDALERQIAGLQVNRPAPAEPPRVAFRVEQTGDRWHLIGEISGTANSGHRELSAATCAELAEAAVLITAIAIDPDLRSDDNPVVPPPAPVLPTSPPAPVLPTSPPAPVPPTSPAAPVLPTSPAAPVPASEPETQPAPRRPADRRRPSALLGLAAGLGLGTLSAPTGLLRLALGLRGERWSVALAQDFWLPRTVDAPTSPELGGRFWLTATGLRACGILRAGRLEVPLCAMVAAGVMFGEGVGALNMARKQRSPWLAAAAGPGLRVPLGRRLGLLFSAELLAILARPRFEITDRGVLCCGAPVGGQFTGGFELRLP